ncbi:hypothetical protein HWV01_20045 [Moritella sp. 5]|uniref:hypothetical protein n=1 Tax=Moritella sp. 5 TaxID=2746231 RepID=UPI001BA96569|nr:hypothetical protein [Moritella sp. 5]QUM82407.1 hypothetical protein HWV01_20045 [Moritella sp. 5]
MKRQYALRVTTQGPLYPPSEVWDQEGNFVVIGMINKRIGDHQVSATWGAAIVSPHSELPHFGSLAEYDIVSELDLTDLGEYGDQPLYTLPLPLPCNNYEMCFAPQQNADSKDVIRASLPLHDAVPDFELEHSRQNAQPITLNQWVKAEGHLTVEALGNQRDAKFSIRFKHLIPNSLYTVMALREHDLNPLNPTRPGPLGVPHCFVSDEYGCAIFKSIMQNPFPIEGGNRIINIVVLYMSSQCSNGGAIGIYGLGGDIHAQLKLTGASFQEFNTK